MGLKEGIYDETMDTAMVGIIMDEYEEIIWQLYILGKKRKMKDTTLPQRGWGKEK